MDLRLNASRSWCYKSLDSDGVVFSSFFYFHSSTKRLVDLSSYCCLNVRVEKKMVNFLNLKRDFDSLPPSRLSDEIINWALKLKKLKRHFRRIDWDGMGHRRMMVSLPPESLRQLIAAAEHAAIVRVVICNDAPYVNLIICLAHRHPFELMCCACAYYILWFVLWFAALW